MIKRALIAGMWFLSIWGIGGVFHVFLGVPRIALLVPAILVAVTMWLILARLEKPRVAAARREAVSVPAPASARPGFSPTAPALDA